jgi:EcoEI R protein C-terminal
MRCPAKLDPVAIFGNNPPYARRSVEITCRTDTVSGENSNGNPETMNEADTCRTLVRPRPEERGIAFNELAGSAEKPEGDPFALLCHLAYNAPLLTRCERAEKFRKERKDFFDQYDPEARAIEFTDRLMEEVDRLQELLYAA